MRNTGSDSRSQKRMWCRGNTISSTKNARSVKHQTHIRRRDNNLEVENSGEKRVPQNTTKTTCRSQTTEETKKTHQRGRGREWKPNHAKREKIKREKKSTTKGAAEQNQGGKDGKGREKREGGKKGQTTTRERAPGKHHRRKAKEQEQEEEGEKSGHSYHPVPLT